MGPSSPVDSTPVAPSERLQLIDALRGAALLGVYLSNMSLLYTGRAFWPAAQAKALMESGPWYERATVLSIQTVVFGKAMTTFMFLFGLGFALQLGRAHARGGGVTALYARRLLVLLGIGLAHLVLVWFGDILSLYAALGFTLLLLHRCKDRTLLWLAGALLFVSPLCVLLVQNAPQLLGTADPASLQAAAARGAQLHTQLLQAMMGGSYGEVVHAQAAYLLGSFFKRLVVVVGAYVGVFCLGLWAGRRGLFHAPREQSRFFRRLLGWGLAGGLLTLAALIIVDRLAVRGTLRAQELPWLPYALVPLRQLHQLTLAGGYVAGFTLLFQREAWARLLGLFAPVGRMALTNYLGQSLVSVPVLWGYGLGLLPRLGPAASVGFALAVFAAQGVFSHLWLSRFRFGPAEWVWRSLTYGRAQPMSRRPASAPVNPAP